MIYIDFETRSKADIKKEGAWRYSEDESTEPLCMAFAVMSLPVDIWVPGEVFPRDLAYYIDQGHLVEAHNAFFEKAIWRNIMVPQYGWPDIPDDQWACSMARASALALPRKLEKVNAALNLPIQKDLAGYKIMQKLTSPRRKTKNNSETWHRGHSDFRKLYNYCVDDVKAERCLSEHIRPLSDYERKVWLLDQKMNMRGLRVDMEAVNAAIDICEVYKRIFNKEMVAVTKGAIKTITQNAKLLKWIQGKKVKMDSVAKISVINALKKKDLPHDVRAALLVRQKAAKTSTAKYAKMAKTVASDGTLKDLYVYHGAGPGRWAGRGAQPQNLPRSDIKEGLEAAFEILKMGDLEAFEMCYPNVLGALSSMLRGCFIPSEGKEFFGGDFAAIEARVLFWSAKEKYGLKMFREGKDIYVDMAQDIYGKKIIDEDERWLGKKAVLGCCYNMGVDTFHETCANEDVILPAGMAKRAVDAYRNKFAAVVQYWKDMEIAVLEAVDTGRKVRCGPSVWKVIKGFLYCRLPSGRRLAYYAPKAEMVETPWGEWKLGVTYMHTNGYTKKWERTKTYGGKLVENVTQAIARDLMVNSMFQVEDFGYEIVMTTHDELVAECASGSVKQFERLMTQLPDWGEGIPMNVKGWSGSRYLK